MERPTLKAVAFDMDGLMVNTEELYPVVVQTLVERRGRIHDPALCNDMMGRPAPAAFQVMIDWHRLDDTTDQLAVESAAAFAEILDVRLALMPGVVELLTALEQASLPKAVATSSSRSFAHRALGKFGLLPQFQFLLCMEDVTQGKPSPEIYLKAADRLGVSPAELLVLEDSHNGCRAAVASGAFAVAVPGRHSHTHDFTGSQFVADTLLDPRIYAALGLPPP